MSEGFILTGTWDYVVSVVTMLVDDKVLISGGVGTFVSVTTFTVAL